MREIVEVSLNMMRVRHIGTPEWMRAYELLKSYRGHWFRLETIYVGGYLLLSLVAGAFISSLRLPDLLMTPVVISGWIGFMAGVVLAGKAADAVFRQETNTTTDHLTSAAACLDGFRSEHRRHTRRKKLNDAA